MSQLGFFDLSNRYEKLTQMKDPLEKLNTVINWKQFLPLINRAFDKQRKSNAGRKPYNRLLMFKILILQSLYNLSDHQVEYQVRDRLSFMRFLNIHLEEMIPDEKTIWSFREVLVKSKMIEKLFDRFDQYLNEKGYGAELGMIVDASIIEVPKQRNSRDDNKKIKDGEVPESFKENPNKLRQKDIDARWTMKANQHYYGYKDHINVDVKHKLIRKYLVTPGSMGDVKCLSKLIHGQHNTDRKLWADGAYDSQQSEKLLNRYKITNRITHRIRAGEWISEPDARENSRRSKIRKRVEHIFGFIQNSMNGKFIRTIGIARAKAKIGLMNLVHNICRYEQLCRIGVS
jgi:IS5 family transposase